MEVLIRMDNFQRFINGYNSINQFLIKKFDLDSKSTFGNAIYHSKKHDRVISYYFEELTQFMELRNVLTHKSIHQQQEYVLAQPTDEVVNRITMIYNTLLHPKSIGILFGKEVVCFDATSSLVDVLHSIKKNKHTQFPIFENNQIIGLLTENGIANWLAEHVDDDIFSLSETSVKEVVMVEENKDDYILVSDKMSVYEAESLFYKRFKTNNKVLTLIITSKDKPRDVNDLVGIVTAWDLPDLRRSL